MTSVTVATPEIVTKAIDMVMGDRRIRERYASAVGISQERIHSTFMEDLDTRKFSPLGTQTSDS